MTDSSVKKAEKPEQIKNSVSCVALEAHTNDVGHGVSRIDYVTMDSIGAMTGDVIEIIGKRHTVAKCLPLYPSDEHKGVIRIDSIVRNNAGVAIGDPVIVRKVKALAAEKVVVAPIEAIPPIDELYLTDALESVPMIQGDNIIVPYFGGRLIFQVIEVQPEGTVMITKNTQFHIEETLKSPAQVKLFKIIKKIESKIDEQEKLLLEIMDAKTLNDTKLAEIYKKISKLDEVKSYFTKKMKETK